MDVRCAMLHNIIFQQSSDDVLEVNLAITNLETVDYEEETYKANSSVDAEEKNFV